MIKKIKKMAMVVIAVGMLFTLFSSVSVVEAAGENIASGVIDEDYGQITWVINSDGKLTVTGTGDVRKSNHFSVPWYNSRMEIKTAEISVTGMTDAGDLFSGCYNLESVDLSGLSTTCITDMSKMFWACGKLSSLNLSGFSTENVTDMSEMFYGCTSLTEIDLSGFSTSKVTDMNSMFMNCESLESLDVSKFDTSCVTNTEHMFYNCRGLTALNVSNFDTQKVTNMGNMFSGCSGLTKLDVSKFKTENVTNMCEMFAMCSGLTELNVSNFDTQKVTDMRHMFSDCKGLTELDISKFDTSNVTNMMYMFFNCTGLTNLVFEEWNTENVSYMKGLFAGCESLTELNLNSFSTNKVTDMSEVFRGCCNLTDLNISAKFDTSNVTSMYGMFKFCESLDWFDLCEFDTSNVTNMNDMFAACKNLSSLDMFDCDMGKVQYATNFFYGCDALEEIHTPKNVKIVIDLPGEWNSTDYIYVEGLEQNDLVRVTALPLNKDYCYVIERQKGTLNDTDSDGLPDEWEINGADVDGDGIVDIPIHEMGADPMVPDIFVEVDWMYREADNSFLGKLLSIKEKDFSPDIDAFKFICEQFKNHGFNLHIDAGPDSYLNYDTTPPTKWGNLSEGGRYEYSNKTRIRDLDEMNNWETNLLDSEVFSEKRASIFRHCLIVNDLRCFTGTNDGTKMIDIEGMAFGIPSQFFIVEGKDKYFLELLSEDLLEEININFAASFMHELGHTLGLSHGGISKVNNERMGENYKANYISVMNYLYSNKGLYNMEGMDKFNYAEFSLKTIEEGHVNEKEGLDPSGLTEGSNLGATWIYTNSKGKEENGERGIISKQPIDFNMDNKFEEDIELDLNNDGKIGMLLSTHRDWDFIDIKANFMKDNAAKTKITSNNFRLSSNDTKMLTYLKNEVSTEERHALGLMGYPGDCEIIDVSPTVLHTSVPNQMLTIWIENTHNTVTSPTLKVTSALMNINYEETITITGEQYGDNAYKVEIPVEVLDKKGIYPMDIQLLCENETIKEVSLEVEVNEPEVVTVAVGQTKFLYAKDDEVLAGIEWHVEDEEVATIQDGTVHAGKIGETLVYGNGKEGVIRFKIKVTKASEEPEHKKSVTEIFTDVYDDWYTPYVQYVYDNGLMTGIKGTTLFQPNSNITKAQVAQVLYNMEQQPAVKEKKVFTDLSDVYEAEWYASAVAWAYNSGVVTGDLNTKKFNPNADVTREQLALMMYRYAKFKSYNVNATSDFAGLVNADKVAEWSMDGVKWAVGSGLISGIDKGGVKDLDPQGNATRAQMAAILQRFCEGVRKELI